MKTSFLTTLAVAAASFVTTAAFAQITWETVSDFQYAPGKSSNHRGVAASADGTIFVASSVTDATNLRHGLIQRSLDGGATWDTVLDVTPAGFNQVATSLAGEVLAVGGQGGTDGKWLTYRSSDGGVTWSLADQFQFLVGKRASAYSLTIDGAKIYVSGWAVDAQDTFHWLVRRSTDSGLNWTTADDLPAQSSGASAGGYGITMTPAGSVIAVGELGGFWTVRRSGDGGNTWSTVDNYQFVSPYSGTARGITATANGDLYVTGASGYQYDNIGMPRWITRKSTDDGVSWSTVDDFISDDSGQASGVTVDAFGRVIVCGGAGFNSGTRWVVRVSIDAGATWVTTDDYQLLPPLLAFANAVTGDPSGNVFVVGNAYVGDGLAFLHGIVRKLSEPPRLSCGHSGGQLRLSWPTNATGFVLQSATTLTNSGNWQDSNLTPTEINGQKVVTITPTEPCGFFRLRGP